MIRRATLEDAARVAEIYNHYIEHTVVTFEEVPLSDNEIAERMESVNRNYDWVVFEENDQILGFAYVTEWNKRSAYRFTAELTVYLDPLCKQRGIGSALYAHLIHMYEAKGIQSFIGGITLPNPASVRLHEKFGFKKAAHYEKVGFKQNRWLDVGYWQRPHQKNEEPQV